MEVFALAVSAFNYLLSYAFNGILMDRELR